MNPFLPLGVPWHAPALHPPTFMAAITSRRKLTGAGLSSPATVTGTRVSLPLALMTTVAVPFFTGRRNSPSCSSTTPAGSTFASTTPVRSRAVPSAYFPVTTSCRASRAPVRVTAAG